jgi:uncharacterized protein
MSDNVNVTVEDNPARSRFEAVDESGLVAGFAEYAHEDGHVVFTHTVVDDAFEGQGVGSMLVREALDQVRESGSPVAVRCEFVSDFIDRHPEYQDLLDAE